MGITNSNKLVSADRIDCDGSLRVTLALTAAPDIVTNPTDIALVLDRSGSMTGEPMANMKLGAKTFIDIISEATGGSADGQIGSGSRIGSELCRHCRGQHAAHNQRRRAEKRGRRARGYGQHQPRRCLQQGDRAL